MTAFDEKNHCTVEGYATYHKHRRGLARFRLRCWFNRHIVPKDVPYSAEGRYLPPDYWRCPRCHGHMKHFVVGQHRFGGLDRVAVVSGNTQEEQAE